MTERRLPQTAVENLVEDLASKANADLSNLNATGQAKFDAKANAANTVTTDTNQTISGSKQFTQPSAGMSIELVADTNQQTVPAVVGLRQLGLYRNATYTKGDGYTSWIQAGRGTDGWNFTELYTRRFLESDSQEIINYFRLNISPDGIPVAYTRTPPAGSVGEEIVTAGWFRQSGCTARTVIETYRKGSNWYRVWSDGWIEQGGVVNVGGTVMLTGNLLKPFSNTNYSILTTGRSQSAATNAVIAMPKTNSTFSYYWGTSNLTIQWYACGY